MTTPSKMTPEELRFVVVCNQLENCPCLLCTNKRLIRTLAAYRDSQRTENPLTPGEGIHERLKNHEYAVAFVEEVLGRAEAAEKELAKYRDSQSKTYAQGRLDQFLRMKNERPADPVW